MPSLKADKTQAYPKMEYLPLVAVFLAAVLMKLPVLESWWCLDDWGQLARAAGAMDSFDSMPARWLSQNFYWSLTHPVFGLYPVPYSISRMVFHAIAALTVVKIARNAGAGSIGSLVSGFLFASSPISFSAIYWASGIQELLGGLFALLAIERWFAKGQRHYVLPVFYGICSILSKETGLVLPLLFLGSVIWSWRKNGRVNPAAIASVILLFLVGVLEISLVLNHFATGSDDPYVMGGFLAVLGNLGKFGWWLLTQGPVFTAQVTWTLAGIGIGFFFIWLLLGIFALKRKVYLPLILLLAAGASLAPALVLVNQARPYMGYLAMACLAILPGVLWPNRWEPKGRKLGIFVSTILFTTSVAWGLWSMDFRVSQHDENGFPSDPVVRATLLSHDAFISLAKNLPDNSEDNSITLVIFQQPLRAEDILMAKRNGDKSVVKSPTYPSLEGEVGLSLLTGDKDKAFWVNSLLDVPIDAFVFCETNAGFEFWGNTRNALLNATLVDVFIGNYEQAEEQLLRAMEIDSQFKNYEYDSTLLNLYLPLLRSHAGIFLEHLLYAEDGNDSLFDANNVANYEGFLDLLGTLPK